MAANRGPAGRSNPGRPGAQPNMQQMAKQLQKVQQQMADAQAQLAETEVSGSAGGGLVSATVSGTGDVLAVKIDPKAVDADDVETLEDLVVAAIRDAAANAQQLQETTMGPLTGGLGGLGLPGT